jgi:low temperature requirement protein LtrA
MRLSLVALWMRVAKHNPDQRVVAKRYIVGLFLCQIGWTLLNFVAPTSILLPGIFVLIACELFVPAFAEAANADNEESSSFHQDHIIERYGLLTIIVLGESLLAISMAITALTQGELFNPEMLATIVGALLIMFACWWLYFDEAEHHLFDSFRGTFIWGYSHFFIFGALAALGGGLAVMVDFLTDHAKIGAVAATGSVTMPTAIFLLFLWFIHERPKKKSVMDLFLFPVFAGLILLTTFAPYGVLLTGILLVICLIFQMNQRTREQ